jgi:hypothetical protein
LRGDDRARVIAFADEAGVVEGFELEAVRLCNRVVTGA